MPNWCGNNLYITGDRVAIADFIKRVTLSPEQQEKQKQNYDILGQLYPTPQELVETVSGYSADETEQSERNKRYEANFAKYGARDWYDWNCRNWGTKWGDSDTWLNGAEGDTSIEFGFQSAWSPPIEGITRIATMFPTLKFALAYEEMGMGFYGFTTFEDGEVLDNCEQVEDIDGWSDIDFDKEEDDYDPYVISMELLSEAQDQLREGAGW
jgi:hypothetical protein